jgi:hypothetical protein
MWLRESNENGTPNYMWLRESNENGTPYLTTILCAKLSSSIYK